MYEFKYTLNDNDYLEFNRVTLSSTPVSKKSVTIIRLIVPMIFVIMFFCSLYETADFDPLLIAIEFILYAFVSIAWCFLVKPVLTLGIKLQIKLIKKHGKLPYGQDATIYFGEDSITEITTETETKLKYSSIENVICGTSAIYVYINAMQALIVPLSVFQTTQQRDAFLNFIHKKWNTAKGLDSV